MVHFEEMFNLPPLPPKKKSQYVPQIAPILSTIFFDFLPDNLKNTLVYLSKKSTKVPCAIITI